MGNILIIKKEEKSVTTMKLINYNDSNVYFPNVIWNYQQPDNVEINIKGCKYKRRKIMKTGKPCFPNTLTHLNLHSFDYLGPLNDCYTSISCVLLISTVIRIENRLMLKNN